MKKPAFNAKLAIAPTPTIHALLSGLAICGFSKKVPRDWPKHNYWVSAVAKEMHHRVTCGECKKVLKRKK